MAKKIHTLAQFGMEDGKLITDSGATLGLGEQAHEFAPYELLLGALSYCLFSTFVSIAQKMQLEYTGVDLDVNGVKRDEKVATLETCDITVTAKGVTDQGKFNKAFEIATRYCSIFQTLSKVATMRWTTTFA
ncbi:MAG: OsmC family protein [Sphaerochaetaceae bacterium]|jgi:putative redox protein|nr:OsmC family protein [Sphaerochaetaceae bacterium]MDX9939357.1 OsmC family protein [Sphaerochaetaceae bacterium]